MSFFLIVIVCTTVIWWFVRVRIHKNNEATIKAVGKYFRTDRKCLDCHNALSFTQQKDGLYCGLCKNKIELDRPMHCSSATIGFDGIVAAFSGMTVEEARAERERNSEVMELRHLGMLRESSYQKPLSEETKKAIKDMMERHRKEWGHYASN